MRDELWAGAQGACLSEPVCVDLLRGRAAVNVSKAVCGEPAL